MHCFQFETPQVVSNKIEKIIGGSMQEQVLKYYELQREARSAGTVGKK